MLALIYFALAACVGDFLCRRFYQFESVAHRCAAAILVGILASSWFTYLAGLLRQVGFFAAIILIAQGMSQAM